MASRYLWVLFALCIAFPTFAESVNTVSFINSAGIGTVMCGANPAQEVSASDGLVHLEHNGSGGGCGFSARATAAGGSVGLTTSISGGPLAADLTPAGITTSAQSKIVIDIETPVDYDGTPIPISVNANQSGAIDVTFDSPSGTVGGSSKLTTSIVLNGRRGFGLNVFDVTAGNSNFAEVGPGAGRGEIAGVVSTGVLLVNAFFPVELTLTMTARQLYGTLGFGLFDSKIDAGHTFALSTDGPALILPEGFSAYSTSGEIVDNQFFAPAIVPLPSALYLLTATLALLVRARSKP